MTNQVTSVTETVSACLLSPALTRYLLKVTAHVCTLKMTDNELSAHSAYSHSTSRPCKNLLSLSSSCLLIWHLGVSGPACHVEAQEFVPWVQFPYLHLSQNWDYRHGPLHQLAFCTDKVMHFHYRLVYLGRAMQNKSSLLSFPQISLLLSNSLVCTF
jgi:hypothetical protein